MLDLKSLWEEFHIRSSLDTLCTNPMRLVWKIRSVFVENACTLSLLKSTFLTCIQFLGRNWLSKRKIGELRIWNSFRQSKRPSSRSRIPFREFCWYRLYIHCLNKIHFGTSQKKIWKRSPLLLSYHSELFPSNQLRIRSTGQKSPF